MTTDNYLYELAERYNATITETEHSVSVRLSGHFLANTYEGCDRYHHAIRYIMES